MPQVAQEKLTRKSLLPVFGHLLVLAGFGNAYQESWLLDLPKVQDEADQPKASGSFFLYFLETGETIDFFTTSGMSPEGHDISKIIETLASSLAHLAAFHRVPKIYVQFV